jgi:hypothetical protein
MRPNPIGWFLVALFLGGGIALTILLPGAFIGQIWIGVAVLLAVIYGVMDRRANRSEQLQREGIPGRAEILGLTQTGMYYNEQPRIRLKLRVEAPGVPSFETTDTYTVPLAAVGALATGGALAVYLDRRDPKRFTIDWLGASDAPSASTADRLRELTKLRDTALISDAEFERQRARILNQI